MCNYFTQRIQITIVALVLIAIKILLDPHVVMAQSPSPFLNSPYYGAKGINSYFDHGYPTYGNYPNTTYNHVIIFNGGDSPSCNPHCYDGHDGIDFAMSYEPVLAAAAGIVTRASWWNSGNRFDAYGLVVEVNHTISVGGQNVVYKTRYGHLSAIAVTLNQTVQAGQIIGTSGSTGNSTGPHLHFGLINSNTLQVDPFGWSGAGADAWQAYSGAVSHCLWKEGEWANTTGCGGVNRPIPAPVNGGEIIVDDTTNNTNGFRKGSGGGFQNPCTGDCQGWVSASAGVGGHIYHTPADRVNTSIDQWAEWVPSGIPNGGAVYEILVHAPNAYATSWQAPYAIIHAAGTAQAVVDQYGLSNQWVSIGTYRMNPGNYVWTHDVTGETFGQHCGANTWCDLGVDAVKFVRRGTTYAPDVRYNNNGWTSAVTLRNNGGGLAGHDHGLFSRGEIPIL